MKITYFGHYHKSIISCRNMIDSGLILVPKYMKVKKYTQSTQKWIYESHRALNVPL